MSIFKQVKKYLLLLSIFFSITITAHLVYVYLYDGATKFPVVGGTLSVGFVGDVPSINPFEFSQNPSNDYILKFLYKSLLRYDITTRRMEGDLANCDLGKDFSKIKCFINSDNLWSDGTPITKEDVLSTYKAIKETDINKPLKQILSSIDITDKGDYIEFSSTNADVLLLDAFAIPIVKKSQLDMILGGESNDTNVITSGPYIFGQKEFDSKYNIKKVTIFRRETGTKDIYISKYIFKFFGDSNSLLKNEDSLNIIFEDSNTKKLFVSPRFLSYNYNLPQYVGLFLNTEKMINTDLRKFLVFQLDNANYTELYGKNLGQVVYNPFFTKEKITPELTNKNIVSILNSLGFFKKEVLSSNLEKKYEEMLKPQKTSVGIPSSSYFTTPSNKKISFISNLTELLISGNVPAGVEGVYIDDYKLSSFIPGNTKFYFRAKKEFGTLKPGINNYSLSFEIAGKKVKKETITVYAYEKQADLDNKKQEILDSLSKSKELTQVEKDKISQEKKDELAKLSALDSIYYYDKNLDKFNLSLEYSNSGPLFVSIAEKIKNELMLLGISVNIKPADQARMEEIINKGTKSYDMLLTGVNNGLYYYNISPFFHSGQAKQGFNFSKLKNVPLDLLLEKLKSSTLTEGKLADIEKESLEVIGREAVVKTFYSPYSVFYIDKNIKNVENTSMLPYAYYSYETIKNSYIKEDAVIDFTKKNAGNFFVWIKKYF
ncbi:MAG: ABC transporter substrate-binding protein [Candidatus Gracilibacteria bacterium]|nr:ABC transporter substrate-binding protein [Candidatus Gracilibacteria bacterium]